MSSLRGTATASAKGLYVYQGSLVKDEFHEVAPFNELGSSLATLEGAKAVDDFGG